MSIIIVMSLVAVILMALFVGYWFSGRARQKYQPGPPRGPDRLSQG